MEPVDDRRLSIESIQERVQLVFAGAEISSCTRFPGAHDNLNYDLRLSSPPLDVVLKAYLHVDNRRIPWKETHLLRMLTSETGVPVPRVLHFAEHADPALATPWALHTRLPGQPLSELLDTLDEGQLESVGYEMGRYLGHIHRVPLSQFGEFFVPDAEGAPTERGYVIAQAARWLVECTRHKLLAVGITEALHEVFSGTTLLDLRQACLIHGDLLPENVIVEQGTVGYHVTGLVEFEHARGGSPEADMSWALGRQTEALPDLRKGFLDGYAETGSLGTQFWDRLRLLEALANLATLVTAHRIGQAELAEERRRFLIQFVESEGIP